MPRGGMSSGLIARLAWLLTGRAEGGGIDCRTIGAGWLRGVHGRTGPGEAKTGRVEPGQQQR